MTFEITSYSILRQQKPCGHDYGLIGPLKSGGGTNYYVEEYVFHFCLEQHHKRLPRLHFRMDHS